MREPKNMLGTMEPPLMQLSVKGVQKEQSVPNNRFMNKTIS